MAEILKQKIERSIKSISSREIDIVLSGIKFTVKNVSAKKIINWIINGASAHIRSSSALGFPTQTQIEPTARCNLKCTACPSSMGLERENVLLSFDAYKKYIDSFSNYLLAVTLHNWGEPFLNPDIYKMIQYANDKNIVTSCNTNAHVFKIPEKAEKLVESKLDFLTVGIDGINQESYEKFRQNGSLESVINGIKNIVDFKKKTGSKNPIINFRFIIMRHNENEIPFLKYFAERTGVDFLSLKTFNNFVGGLEHNNAESLQPMNDQLHRFKKDPINGKAIMRKYPICNALWSNPVLHCNGVLCGCFNDHNEQMSIGSIDDNSFTDLWNCQTFKRLRKTFSKNWSKMEKCSHCTLSYIGGDCADEAQRDLFVFSNAETQKIRLSI